MSMTGAPYTIGDDLCQLVRKEHGITEIPNGKIKRGLKVMMTVSNKKLVYQPHFVVDWLLLQLLHGSPVAGYGAERPCSSVLRQGQSLPKVFQAKQEQG